MGADLICPNCGTPVPNGDLFGYEDPYVWDGVIVWTDGRCGTAWPRFPVGDVRHDAGVKTIRGWNAAIDEEADRG